MIIKVTRKKEKLVVDAVEYYEDLLKDVIHDIEKIKSKEYRFIGTCYVTFSKDLPAR